MATVNRCRSIREWPPPMRTRAAAPVTGLRTQVHGIRALWDHGARDRADHHRQRHPAHRAVPRGPRRLPGLPAGGLRRLPTEVTDASGTDARNYGGLQGIAELREMFAELLWVSPEQVIAGGNS